MGLYAAEGVGVVFQERQEVQKAGGGRAALRPGVEGERQAAGLHPASQNPGQRGEIHPHRGRAGGKAAGLARRPRRESLDHDRRGENFASLNFDICLLSNACF